jgi:hypothetical protein
MDLDSWLVKNRISALEFSRKIGVSAGTVARVKIDKSISKKSADKVREYTKGEVCPSYNLFVKTRGITE